MSAERLEEIKDSIHDLLTIKGDSLELINEEIELYNEVVRLLEEDRRLKQACKVDYEGYQEIMGELKEEINKLSHLVANKVIADYDYDSVLKRELNEERRKNVVLTESKNIIEKENKELKKTIDIVASLVVHSETEAIGKEKLISCVEELHREHEILTKFEEWLKFIIKQYDSPHVVCTVNAFKTYLTVLEDIKGDTK